MDIRYETVKCPECGQSWQRIDWGCALHAYGCKGAQQQQPITPALLEAIKAV